MGKATQYLSVSDLERIAESLFQVKNRKKGELIGLCPVHDDKNPSFSYNPVKDMCHCFSCGFKGDIITLWSRINGYTDPAEGFKAFCEHHGIADQMNFSSGPDGSRGGSKKDKGPPPLDDAYGLLGDLSESWMKRLQQTRGWSPEVIRSEGLKAQTHYQVKDSTEIRSLKRPDRIAIPIFDSHGHVRNIRLYKPGDQRRKIFSWGARYGEARLYPAVPLAGDPILLVEGEADRLCAFSHGFNAVTQTSKPKKWKKEHLAVFRDRHVVIAFDADQPGEMYAEKYAAPALSKVAKSVRILTWPDFMGRREDGMWPEDHGQDLTDFFVRHRKAPEDLQELIDEAAHFEKPDENAKPQALKFFARGAGSDRLSFKPRLLAEEIIVKRELLSDPETGLLYRWNGRFWERYHHDHIKRIAVDMLGDESTTSRVNDAATQALILATIPHNRNMNDMDEWLCLRNGMLNYKTLEMQDHAKDFYAAYELNVAFNPDSKKVCDRWLKYLDQTVQTPEIIAQVQEFFGYCLLREVPFAKCLLLLGPGSDGKSTMIKVLKELVGPENTSAVAFSEMEDQFLRSSLYQKTVNISTEVGARAIESSYFKAITSGDTINAAFKHQDAFEFTPYCKLVFASNRLPRVLDNSDGFYRRFLPIQFKRQFLEGAPDTDPYLEKKLLAERSEIFQWALVGLHRLLKNRMFTDSLETRDLLQNYRRLNSHVICFVEDLCTLDEGGHVQKTILYEKYRDYCRDSGNSPYAKQKFFRELYAAVTTLKSSRPRANNPGRKPCVEGIRLEGFSGGFNL